MDAALCCFLVTPLYVVFCKLSSASCGLLQRISQNTHSYFWVRISHSINAAGSNADPGMPNVPST